MSLSEYEKGIWQDMEKIFNDEFENITEQRNRILEQAQRVPFHDIPLPFEAPIFLQFNRGGLLLQLEPWADETEPLLSKPVLARIKEVAGDCGPFFRGADTVGVGDLIGLMGPSIETTRLPEDDDGSIALGCSLSFYRARSKWSRPIIANSFTPPVEQVFATTEEIPIFRETD